MLLNLSVFMWFGAVCPWPSFANNDVIPIYRLIFLAILILIFRRLPIVFALHWKIWQIEQKQQALFVGFFGPIGVSAVFYLYLSLDFLRMVTVEGEIREDAKRLEEVFTVVIWFLAICSIIVHGLSIPLGKVGYHLPRTISSRVSSQSRTSSHERDPNEPEVPFHINRAVHDVETQMQPRQRGERDEPARPVFRIGRSTIKEDRSESGTPKTPNNPNTANTDEIVMNEDVEKVDFADLRAARSNTESVHGRLLSSSGAEQMEKEAKGREDIDEMNVGKISTGKPQ